MKEMMEGRWKRAVMSWLVCGVVGCGGGALEGNDVEPSAADVQVLETDATGSPKALKGHLGRLTLPEGGAVTNLGELGASLEPVIAHLGLHASDLRLRRDRQDETGHHFLRLTQHHKDVPIFGSELVIVTEADGDVVAMLGNARGNLKASERSSLSVQEARASALKGYADLRSAAADAQPQPVYFRRADDEVTRAWQVVVSGERADGTPVRDLVLVDAADGTPLQVVPRIHSLLSRMVYSANHGTSLPGTPRRLEGWPADSDSAVNTNYNHLKTTYDCYQTLFGRYSIDDKSMPLVSTVHYDTHLSNAFWNGSQMAFGDGDGVRSTNLAFSLDVTAHELTHGVTQYESGLEYAGESGGLNEAMSDIFGSVCDWYGDGKVINTGTWLVGEDIWTPATPGDALRYMNDPARDGRSLDFYTSSAGNSDVHYSSGIANLAFHLLAQGGQHPRGKTTHWVQGIGIEAAARIFYKANRDLMGPSTTFFGARMATELAADLLGYGPSTKASVASAWEAVGVSPIPLQNLTQPLVWFAHQGNRAYFKFDVPPGAADLRFTLRNGAGDADLYVDLSTLPTEQDYLCRSTTSTSNETCTFPSPRPGTWYVMLKGYTTYYGVELSASYSLQSGVAVTSLAEANVGGIQYFKLNVPADTTQLQFLLTGGTGDADLYVRQGSLPTLTDYTCRSFNLGNEESCTLPNPGAGTWYVMLHAFSPYRNTSLKGTYQGSPLTSSQVMTPLADPLPWQQGSP